MAFERALRKMEKRTALAFVLTAACASHAGAGSDDHGASASSGSPAAAGQVQTMTGGGTTAGQSNQGTTGGSALGGASAGSSSSSGNAGSPSSGGTTQCRDEVPAAEWDANCLACAGDDSCAGCLCMNCAQALRDCDSTEGCSEIVACVQASACQGIDCYCGTDILTVCVAGGGNGPCKDAILNAPGGKAPTPADLSGGPASDAVAEVAVCMQNQNTCGSLCN